MDTQSSFTGFSKIFCYSLGISLVVFVVTAEWFLRAVVVKMPRSTPQLIDRVYQSKLTDVVAGDSQMYRAFVAEKSFINLAKRGNPIPAVDIVLRNYLLDKHPGKVVIQASPQLFAKPQLERNTQRYDQYFNIVSTPFKLYVFERGITEFMSAFDSMDQIMAAYHASNDEDLRANSQYWLKLTDQQRQQKTRSRVKHHLPYMDSDESKEFQAKYRQMVEFLISKGAEVCMVTPPVSELYLTYSRELAAFDAAMAFFTDVSSEYGITHVGHHQLNTNYPKEYFINQDHITPSASKEFAASVLGACFD
ncbi:hypothetical protein [Marinicella litoralis]|uniref:DUF1574 domain-containing protein n=1 Tax=Marinicella litoralis TaxID=644220 RepID=A0A4R6XYQ0_9GAMM|nr:hypothetical protein [Marinicella litoralis]TDR23769.1 hypothetical protein C8D91_0635 [Marinicella litoralis]